ncbi:hypothetical protein AB0J63_48555 [Streptosporangium canum]|uniref:hypothetical protein n=1 Tax=Streptosporangium canum TaxID=324952 RepID=UPI003423D7C4
MPLFDHDDSALMIIDVQANFDGPKRLDVDRLQFHRVERIAWLTTVASSPDVLVVVTEEDPT